ncbi:MAG: hypothetical protein HFJ27_03225 [Clostridia bacterium]|nr:hypothetical protein [Clostridia bacterium]
MVNVTVINIRTLIKYIGIAFILICLVFLAKATTKTQNTETQSKISTTIKNFSFLSCVEKTLPDVNRNGEIQKLEENTRKVTSRSSSLRKMLGVELSMMNSIIEDEKEEEPITTESSIEQANMEVETTQIEEHNITPKYNSVYGSVKIKNESSREITEEILTPNISLENKKDVIIFHTHTCESYTPTENFNYTMSGSYRTTDFNYNVARVGSELEAQLTSYGFNVIHDKTYHDYPEYSGSYGRSLETVKKILSSHTETQMVIDLHRDAVGSKPDYAPCVKIGDETAAQMMFVIGTDGRRITTFKLATEFKICSKSTTKSR